MLYSFRVLFVKHFRYLASVPWSRSFPVDVALLFLEKTTVEVTCIDVGTPAMV